MNAQCGGRKGLGDMVQAPDMEPFMLDDVFLFPGFQAPWQVYPGFQDAHYEWGHHFIHDIDVLFQGD